jgi:hypothetical protein
MRSHGSTQCTDPASFLGLKAATPIRHSVGSAMLIRLTNRSQTVGGLRERGRVARTPGDARGEGSSKGYRGPGL